MKCKLGEMGDELFSSQTVSFRVIIWSEKMKEWFTNGGEPNPCHQRSRFWPMQTHFMVYVDLLVMVEVKFFL